MKLVNHGAAALLAGLLAACASSPAPVLLTLPSTTVPVADASTSSGPAIDGAAPGGTVLAGAASGAVSAAAARAASASAPVLVVRRINIPEYMVSRRVRFRADPSTLAEWPNTYWAERIEIGVSREFVAALRRALPLDWIVCEAACTAQGPMRTLQVDLLSMDYVRSAQRLQARARVAVGGADATAAAAVAPQSMQTREFDYALPTDGDSAQAQARAIAELIHQLAQASARLVVEAGPR